MDLERELTAIERGLWTNDPVFYKSNLMEEALLLFAETGVITRDAAVDAIREENAEGRRWAEVNFDDLRLESVAEGVAVLVYRVAARWEHEAGWTRALASSIYVNRDGAWKVRLHQQTPI